MPLIDCLIKAYNEKLISEETKDEIIKQFANGKDVLQIIADFKHTQQRRKYIKTLQHKKEVEILTKMEEMVARGENPADMITSLYTKGFGTPSGNDNVEYTAMAVRGYLERKFAQYKPDMATTLGFLKFNQDKELIDDVARALADNVGLKTDKEINPKAREIAKAWEDMSEEARKMFNDNGGDIGKLDSWMLPQAHDNLKLYDKGYEKWKESAQKAFTLEDYMAKTQASKEAELEIKFAEKMATYEKQIEAAKKIGADLTKIKRPEREFYQAPSEEDIWKGIYENITTPRAQSKNQSALYNSRQEERVLKPRDIESYIEYQKEFGNPDYFQTMEDHIRGISQDIALLKILGPNPNTTHQKMKELAVSKGELSSLREGFIDAVFDVANGRADQSLSRTKADLMMEGTMGFVRGINTAAMLGSATISSITDIANVMMRSGLNGTSFNGILAKASSNMFTSLESNAQDAMRAGLIADVFTASGINSKWSETGTGWAQKAGEYVLRASLLNRWTNSIKVAFETEMSSHIAGNFDKALKDLPEDLQMQFKRYGISEAQWNMAKRSKPLDINGVKFLDPDTMDRDTYFKFISMIKQESDQAVIMSDFRTRAITTGGKAKGTIGGELARATTQFKAYPISFMATHLSAIFKLEAESNWTRAQYAAKLLAATTILGAVAMTLKDISSGKTPRDPSTPQFWMASLLQGGGLGIFGDVFFTDSTKYGNSFWSAFVGPASGRVEDLFKLTVQNIHQFAKGQETNFGSELVQTVGSYVPGQNLWYSKLLTNRLIFDSLKDALDPDYHAKIRRQTTTMQNDFHQNWLWKPTDNLLSLTD